MHPARYGSSSGGPGVCARAGFIFLSGFIKKQGTQKASWGRGWGGIKSAGPAPRTITNKAAERSAHGRADPTRGGGARPHWRVSPFAPPWGVAGARRGLWQVSAGPAPPPVGPAPPGLPRKASVMITIAARARPLSAAAERATATSPGPPPPPPFVSAARPRAGAASRRALRPAASSGTAAERQPGERAENSLFGGFIYIYYFSECDYFCLKNSN